MTTNKASERLMVDVELVPLTAILAATLALGISLHDIFAIAMGALGLACVVGICACEFYLRKIRREVEEYETGGNS